MPGHRVTEGGEGGRGPLLAHHSDCGAAAGPTGGGQLVVTRDMVTLSLLNVCTSEEGDDVTIRIFDR